MVFSLKKWPPGFTLIELLIVIALMGVLAGVVFSILSATGVFNQASLLSAKEFSKKVENDVGLYEVGKWSFDDESNPLLDTSGHDNTGVISGATYDESCNNLGYRGCLLFSGSQYAMIPDAPNLRIETYTVSVWIWPNGTPNEAWKGIVGKPGRGHNIWLNQTGYIHHRYHTDLSTNAGAPNTPSGSIKWDIWNHIVITNDGVTAKTYINGELKASGAVSGNLIADSTTVYIGRNLDGASANYFNGYIDEVVIYSRALTSQAIQKIYARESLDHFLSMK